MKTALVLGGGGARGSYQLGVWKALRELGIFPDIITGTSVGALNGALMVQDSFEQALELWKNIDTKAVFDFICDPTPLDYVSAFFRQGGVGRSGLSQLMKIYLQEDKIRTSSISFGMMLARKEGLVPCPVFVEDVPSGMLSDYLMATTACFPAAQCHKIAGVEYLDGGYCDNLPVALAKEKGADKIITVSLDTWHARTPPFSLEHNVIPIYPRWNLGSWLCFRKENTERNIRLGYLDAMKAFGKFDGDIFTFHKHTFDTFYLQNQVALCRWKRLLQAEGLVPEHCSAEKLLQQSAEITGRLFRLSPYCVYTADSFVRAIRRKQNFKQYASAAEEKIANIFLSRLA